MGASWLVRHGRRIVTIVLCVGLGVGILWVGAETISALRLNVIERRWARGFESFEQVLARHPPHETNDSALRIEALAARLGIDLVPRLRPGRPPRAVPNRSLARSDKPLGNWLDTQLRSSSAAVDPPPEPVARWLVESEPTLAELDRLLEAGSAPSWGCDIRELHPDLPNLLGHIELQRVLLARALVAARAGAAERASLGLETSWRLNQALRDEPVLIGQLVAAAIARQQAGVLRKMGTAPAHWQARLVADDWRRAFLETLSLEGLNLMRLAAWKGEPPEEVRAHLPDKPSGILEKLENTVETFVARGAAATFRPMLTALGRPLWRMSIAQAGESLRQQVSRLSDLESWCDRDLRGLDTVEASLWSGQPRWIFAGWFDAGQYTSVADRIGSLEFDLELTARVLEVERFRAEHGGRWPFALLGGESSRACPEEHWIWTRGDDGSASIVLSREPTWDRRTGLILPATHVWPPIASGPIGGRPGFAQAPGPQR